MGATAVLQLLGTVAGLCLLTYILFSYEDEEKGVSSLLEAAWIKLSDFDLALSGRINGFLTSLAQGAAALLNRIYGALSNSGSAIATSASLIFGVGFLFNGYLEYSALGDRWLLRNVHSVQPALRDLLMAVACFAVPFMRSPAVTVAALGSATLLQVEGLVAAGPLGIGPWTLAGPSLLMLVLLNWGYVAYDVATLALSRVVLQRIALSPSLRKTLAWAICLILLGAAMIALLAALASALEVGRHHSLHNLAGPLQTADPSPPVASVSLPDLVFVLLCMHVATFGCVALFFLLVVLTLITRIAVGVMPRAAYAAIKFKVLSNRKVAAALATSLIGLSFPGAAAFIKNHVAALL